MSSFINEQKQKMIVALVIILMIITGVPAISLSASVSDPDAPQVTEYTKPQRVRAGSELSFTITAKAPLDGLYYQWDRNLGNKIDKTKPDLYFPEEYTEYTFKITIPSNFSGLHEFSIAAVDHENRMGTWKNIQYYVLGEDATDEELSADNEGPEMICVYPDYPQKNEVIEQGRSIKFKLKDDSGVYYYGYKWVRELGSYTQGMTYTYNPGNNDIELNAPTELGDWYLQVLAVDGKHQPSMYWTKVTVADKVSPVVTLIGEATMDVDLNAEFEDPGAKWTDNVDGEKTIYANEKLDTSKVGPQVLTYSCDDSAGNKSNVVTRTVTVVGTETTYELKVPNKKIYKFGEQIDLTGAEIKIISERGEVSTVPVTKDMFTDFTTNSLGKRQAIFKYEGKKAIYSYEVTDFVNNVEIIPPQKLEYEYGEELDLTGGKVKVTYASGAIDTVDITTNMISEYNKYELGSQYVLVTYQGRDEVFQVTVGKRKVTISIDNKVTVYGDEIETLTSAVTEGTVVEGDDLGISLTTTATSSSDVGIYSITGTASNTNYEVTFVNGTYEIAARAVKVTIDDKISTYGDEIETLTSAVTEGTVVDGDDLGISLTTTATSSSDVGTYAITGTSANANYAVTFVDGTYEITARAVKVTIDNKTSAYGEEIVTLTSTVTEGTVVDGDDLGISLSTTATSTSDVGTYAITGTSANANYAVTFVDGTYEITARAVKVTIDDKNSSYGEEIVTLTSTVTEGTVVDGDDLGISLSTTATSTSDVGTYAITGTSANANYAVTFVDGTYEITARAVKVTIDNKTSAYGDELVTLTSTVTEGTVVDGDDLGISLTTTATSSSDVGTYAITGTSANANYAVTFVDGTYEITARAVKVTIDNKTSAYGEELVTLTSAVTEGTVVDGDDLGISLTTTATSSSDVGTYAITGTSANANYAVTFVDGTYEITAREVKVTIDNKTSAYGEEIVTLTSTVTEGTVVEGDDLGISLTTTATSSSDVGTYAITGTSANTNYAVTFVDGTYEITARAVKVTIDNKTSAYGEEIVTLTSTVTEGTVVEGDDLGISLSTTATSSSNVGTYAITGTSANANYAVTFVDGTYEITARDVIVKIDNQTGVYGGSIVRNLTYTILNADSGVIVGEDNLGITISTTATTSSVVGEYPITGTATNTNYNVTFEDGIYTINKKPVTVYAKNITVGYGEKEKGLSLEIPEGTLVGEDRISDLGVTLVREAGNNVGKYAITASNIANDTNYDVTVEPGIYEITAKAIKVTIDNKTSAYGDELVTLTSTVTEGTVVDGDDLGISLSTTATSTSDVGTYAITGTASNTNYAVTFVDGTYEITAKAVKVTIDNKTSAYGDELVTLTSTVTEGTVVDGDDLGISLSTTATSSSDVGTYAITGTSANANYAVTFVDGTYEITTRAVKVTIEDKTSAYGDELVTLTSTVTEGTVVDGDDLGISLSTTATSTSDVGTYAITGTSANANYAVTFVDGTYEITARAVKVTIDDKNSSYGDELVTLTSTVTEGTVVEGDDLGISLTTTATSSSNVGTYAITGTSSNTNYAVTFVDGTYEITARAVKVTIDNKTSAYGDELVTLTSTVTEGTVVEGDDLGISLTTTATSSSNVGTYAITGTSSNTNYAVTFVDGTYEITARAVKVTIEDKTSAYGDELVTLTSTVTEGTVVEGDDLGISLTTTATSSSDVGTYAITGTSANANYAVTFVDGTYEITARAVKVTIDNKTSAYGDELVTLTSTVTEGTVVEGDDLGISLTTTATSSSDVGTYAITGTASNTNYAVTFVDGTYEITARAVKVTIEDKTSAYGDELVTLTSTVTEGTAVEGDDLGISLSTTATSSSDVGTYAITGTSANTNYAVTFVDGTYEITARAVKVTIEDKTSAYGDELVTLTSTVTEGTVVDGDDLGISLSTTATSSSDVGTYAITGTSANANYAVTFVDGTYEITARAVKVTIEDKTSAYGDELVTLTSTVTEGTVVEGDDLGISLSTTATSSSDVGTYAITGTSANANYAVTFVDGTYEITARAVKVTIDNKTSAYGDELVTLTSTVTEGTVVDGDDLGISLSTTATSSSDVGTYAITGTASNTNYAVTFVDGTYEITARAVKVTIDDKTSAYGEEIVTLTSSVTEGTVVEGDDLGISLSTTATSSSDVGTYAITGTASNTNYAVTFVDGTYEITARAVKVTIDNKTSAYGEELVTLTSAVTEGTVVDGDDLGISLTTTATSSSDVGTYAITGTSANANYAVTFVDGTYEITAREVKVTIDNKTSAYGEEIVTLTSTVTEGTVVEGDDLGISLTTTATSSSDVGTYAITGTSANTNYAVTFVDGTYEITARAVKVTIDNKTSAYGEEIVTLTSTVTEGTVVEGDDLGISLSTTATSSSNVGTYAITGTSANANYAVTFVDGTYEITARDVIVKIDNQTGVYGGSIVRNLTYTILNADSGVIVGEDNLGITISTTATTSSVVGEYPITGTATNTNYNVTFEDGIYTINKKPVTVYAKNITVGYGEKEKGLSLEIPEGTLVGEDRISDLGVTLVREAGNNVGKYAITASNIANDTNYDVTVEPGIYEITAKAIKVTIDNKTSAYGDELVTLTSTVTEGTVVDGDDLGISLSTTATSTSDVGTYAITGTASNTNYAVTFVDGTYEITAKAVKVTIDNKTSAYGDELVTLTSTVTEGTVVDGDDLGISLSTTATSSSDVGTYAITGTSANANYAVTFVDGTYEITTRAVKVTIEDKTSAYGDELVTLTSTVTEGTVVDGDDLGISLSTTATSTSDVGTYAITGTSANANYAVTFVDGTYEITARAVKVTIDDKNSSYGDELVTLTSTVTEGTVVEGDDLGISLTTTATSSSNVGTYAITGTSSNTNYAVTFVDGTYEITARAVKVTIDNKTSAYGDELVTLTSTVTEGTVVEGDDLGISLTTTATSSSNVGTYAITGTSSNTNYAVTFVDGTYEITARAVKVTIEDKTSAYGDELVTLTSTVTEGTVVEGDDLGISLTTTATSSSDVGTYAITGTSANANYAVTFVDGTYEITARAVKVTIDNKTSAYGDELVTLTSTVTEGTVVEGDDLGISLTTTATSSSDVGTYAITGTASNTNYAVTFVDGTYEITARAVKVTIEDKTSAYGDELVTLTSTVTEGTAVEGDDLGISLSTTATSSSDVGTYAITGTSANTNYAVTFVDGTYEITARAVKVTIEDKTSAYGDELVTLTSTVTEGTVVDGDDLGISLSTTATSSSDVGTYAITGTSANANYAVTFVDGTYEITARAVKVTIDNKTSAYGDELVTLTSTVTEGTVVDGDDLGISLSTTATSSSDVGTYAITGTSANANYAVTFVDGTYEITARAVKVTIDNKTSAYGDELVTLTSTVTEGTVVDGDDLGISLSTTATSSSDVGTYAITGTSANANYAVTFVDGTYEITARAVKVTIDNKTSAYGDELVTLTSTVTEGTVVEGDDLGISLSTTATSSSDVGTYAITGTASNTNYAVTFVDGTYEITARAVKVTIDDKTSAYGEEIVTLTSSVTEGTVVEGDDLGISLSTTATSSSDVGTYAITGTASNTNYAVTFVDGTYEITARAVKVTIEDKTSAYGDELVTLTSTVTEGTVVDGDDLGISLTTTATSSSDVGTYAITGTSANANYAVTFVDGTYAITARAVKVTIDNKTSAYGDELVTLTSTVTEGTVVEGDDLGISLSTTATSSSDVGTYAITGTSANANYAVTFVDGTYEITKKQIIVTANDVTAVYGGSEKALTLNVPEGTLVGEDTIESLGITLVREAGNNVGTYAITASNIANDTNYAVTVNPGIYTIVAKEVVVTANDVTAVYGESEKTLTLNVPEGTLVGEDTIESLGVTLVREAGNNVGTYAITASNIANDTNYAVTVNPGIYTIVAKEVVVTANDVTAVYGESEKALTLNVPEGTLVGEDTIESLGVTLVREAGNNVGTYAITASNIANDTNYAVTVNPGTYTIVAKEITVVADNKESIYGQEIVPLTFTVPEGALVGEDSAEDLGIELETDATKTSPVTENGYEIRQKTGTTALNENYIVTVTPGIYTILPQEISESDISITVPTGDSAIYDGTAKEVTYELLNGRTANITVTYEGENLVDGKPVNAGTYKAVLTIQGTGNYTGTIVVKSEEYLISRKAIERKDITLDVPTGDNAIYNKEAKEATVTLNEKLLKDIDATVTITYEGENLTDGKAIEVGDYIAVATVKGIGNYIGEVSIEKEFSITKSKVTVGIDNKTSIYGDEIVTLTSSVTEGTVVEGDDLGISLSTTATSTSNVGTYEITGTAANTNYEVTFVNGTYEITARAVKVTIDNKTSAYGDELVTLTSAVTEGTVVDGDDLGISLTTTATSSSDVGTYAITGTSANANYAVTFVDGTYEITARAVKVTIDNKTSAYGDELVTLTSSVTEGTVVDGDDLGISLTTTATSSSDVGTYAITGTSANANYAVTFVDGTYEITARAVKVTIDNKTSAYGDELVTLTSTVTEGTVVDGDDLGISLSTTATSSSDVGTYAITGTSANANYAVTFVDGTYEITARAVKVTIEDKTSAYGDELVTLTSTVTEGTVVEGDDLGISLSTTATSSSDVGTYAITGTSANANYAVTFVDGTYEITARAVKVTIDNKTSAYGDELVTLTSTVTEGTVVDGDDLGISLSTTATSSSDVGTYAITGTASNTNYAVTFVDGTYEITARAVKVTIDDKTSAYGEEIVTLTSSVTEGTVVEGDDLGISLSTTATSSSDVGTYAITGTASNTNYAVTFVDGTYEITATTLTEEDFEVIIPSEEELIFSGESKEVSVEFAEGVVGTGTITVKYYPVLEDGTEGEELASAPINAGKYIVKVDVTNGQNYSAIEDLQLATFTITPKTLVDGDLVVQVPENLLYDKTAKEVTYEMIDGKTANVTVTYEGKDLVENKPVNIGSYTAIVTAEGTGNYTGKIEVRKSYRITADEITSKDVQIIRVPADELVYDGTSKEVSAQVLNGKTADVTITYVGENLVDGKPVHAGDYTATIVVTGTGNYEGKITREIVYTIATKEVTISIDNKNSSYGDELVTLTSTVTEGTVVDGDDLGISLTTTATSTSNVGTYPITGTASNTDYNVTFVDGTYEIVKANPEYTIPTDIKVEVGSTLGDIELPEGFEFDDASTTSVGDLGANTFKATFTPKDLDNYNIVENIDITITVVDTTVPVITLTGDAEVTVEVGGTYTDAGATATDNYDGDITTSIVTVNPVDTAVVGNYTVTYNVTDANGNKAVEVTRTVHVVQGTQEKPVLSLSETTVKVSDTAPVLTVENIANAKGEVTYSLDKEGVITITDNGVISLIGVGEVTITVTFNETVNYKPNSANITLTVERGEGLIGSDFRIVENTFTYDNSPKTVEVVPVISGVTVNDITAIRYYSESDLTTPVAAPTVSGKYQIRIDVAETSLYNAQTDIIVGEMIIDKAEQIAPIVELTANRVEIIENNVTASISNIASAEENPEVTYTSSNTAVATINNNGEITLVGIGTTEITATFAETDNYKTNSGAITLEVIAGTLSEDDFTVENNEYTFEEGTTREATVTSSIEGLTSDKITISYRGENLVDGKPVNAGTYDVVIDVAGTDKYGEAKGLVVGTLTINRKSYDMTNVKFEQTEAYTYDKTAKRITVDETTLPSGVTVKEYVGNDKVNAGEYTVTAKFQVADAINYNVPEEMTATMIIGKATPSYTIPTGLKATYGDRLLSVRLPEGFTFENVTETTEVGNAGTNTFTVKYTPSDLTNYEIATGISVTVEVDKAEAYTLENVTFEYDEGSLDGYYLYDGNAHGVRIVGLPDGIIARYTMNNGTNGNTAVEPGRYTVTATFEIVPGSEIDNNYKAINPKTMSKDFEIENPNIELTDIRIIKAPTQNRYGQELDYTGAQIEITKVNGRKQIIDVTPEMISGYNKTELNEQTVSITYNNKSVSFKVKLEDYEESISLTLTKNEFNLGSTITDADLGPVVTVHMASGVERVITNATISYNQPTGSGIMIVTASYNGMRAEAKVMIKAPVIKYNNIEFTQDSITVTGEVSINWENDGYIARLNGKIITSPYTIVSVGTHTFTLEGANGTIVATKTIIIEPEKPVYELTQNPDGTYTIVFNKPVNARVTNCYYYNDDVEDLVGFDISNGYTFTRNGAYLIEIVYDGKTIEESCEVTGQAN